MFSWITQLDIWVNTQIEALRSPVLDKIMIIITHLGGPVSLILATLVIVGVFFYKKQGARAWLFIIAMSGGWLLYEAVKHIIQRPRPINGLIAITGYSFPSGHVTIATIFFLLLVYFHKNKNSGFLRKFLFITAIVLAIALVGFSRVYLGVHWLSDVLGGFVLGALWVMSVILIFKDSRQF